MASEPEDGRPAVAGAREKTGAYSALILDSSPQIDDCTEMKEARKKWEVIDATGSKTPQF